MDKFILDVDYKLPARASVLVRNFNQSVNCLAVTRLCDTNTEAYAGYFFLYILITLDMMLY